MSEKLQNPLRILIITYQGDVAGSTNSISYLSLGLAALGHIVVLGCRKESLLYTLVADSKVIREEMTFSGRTDLTNMRQIKEVVKKYDIQLINAQSTYDRFTSAFAKWMFGLDFKLIHTRRQMPVNTPWIQRFFYELTADKIVCVSEGIKREFVRRGFNSNKLKVIFNGTPKEKYNLPVSDIKHLLITKYELENEKNIIGCVSRLKQQEQLLIALQKVEIPCVVFFVGININDKLSPLVDLLKNKHRVIFTGTENQITTLTFYTLFTINILPSDTEGLSQSLLEAMAMGVPVIATNKAGNPDLVQDGKNGFLFDDGNTNQLAEKIAKLLQNETLRNNFIEAGKQTAFVDFSIDRTIKNYENFFREMIASTNT